MTIILGVYRMEAISKLRQILDYQVKEATKGEYDSYSDIVIKNKGIYYTKLIIMTVCTLIIGLFILYTNPLIAFGIMPDENVIFMLSTLIEVTFVACMYIVIWFTMRCKYYSIVNKTKKDIYHHRFIITNDMNEIFEQLPFDCKYIHHYSMDIKQLKELIDYIKKTH